VVEGRDPRILRCAQNDAETYNSKNNGKGNSYDNNNNNDNDNDNDKCNGNRKCKCKNKMRGFFAALRMT
jgi:hypothetical protein